MSAAPLWWLLVVWPLLGAAILAIGRQNSRATILSISFAGCVAMLGLVWWMPVAWPARCLCVVVSVALTLRAWAGMPGRLDMIAGFVSAAALNVVGLDFGLAGAAGCLAVQVFCNGGQALGRVLGGQGRVKPVWDAMLVDLAGIVLVLVGDAVPGRPLGAVSGAVGLLMLAGIAGAAPGFCRALLSAAALMVLARHTEAMPLILVVGCAGVWLARSSAAAIVALGCMAAVLPDGQGAALLAVGLVLVAGADRRFAAALIAPPWPGFVLGAWVVASCWRIPGMGWPLALAVAAGFVRRMVVSDLVPLPALGWAWLLWLGCAVASCLVWPV